MLKVLAPDEALSLILCELGDAGRRTEAVPLERACSRALAEDITADVYLPDFERSTVDGYAVMAGDTFGASEALPAMLSYVGEVLMGETPAKTLAHGECMYVPTGGELPRGADAMVMIEYVTDYGDSLRYIEKASSPGQHVVHRGDDVTPGKAVLKKGKLLGASDVGTLAALGYCQVPVAVPPTVAILSTGDELVEVEATPSGAQIRNVNGPMLAAAARLSGCEAVDLGIVKDDYDALLSACESALGTADVLIISGGSSVGTRDATHSVIAALGEPGVLMHGIAIKPGKPTIVGKARDKAIFGLPGNPAAAYFVFQLFVRPLLLKLQGTSRRGVSKLARITANIPSNHGRAECVPVSLQRVGDGEFTATAIPFKSGLITLLSQAEGYVLIARDKEGLGAGEMVEVELF